ncbi:MAG: MgtC/SapB family protein [Acidobacteriaceae bacterium]|nr:MgtC/SapB family protein [Acidobacteriaceae bacterium]
MVNPWLQWWTSRVPLLEQPTYPRLILALFLGSIIGAERQWRQRAAGMRTNTLVCFGAAAFVDLGATIAGPTTTNIIAYVISGVGFLGAGAIMKEGGSIRGLNTAATLWCSAAVGACAGAGQLLVAVFVTALLVGINLILRPVSRFIDKRSLARISEAVLYRIRVTCPAVAEHHVRDLIIRALAERPLLLRELRTDDASDTDDTFVQAVVEASNRENVLLEELVEQLRTCAEVSSVEWAETSLESE